MINMDQCSKRKPLEKRTNNKTRRWLCPTLMEFRHAIKERELMHRLEHVDELRDSSAEEVETTENQRLAEVELFASMGWSNGEFGWPVGSSTWEGIIELHVDRWTCSTCSCSPRMSTGVSVNDVFENYILPRCPWEGSKESPSSGDSTPGIHHSDGCRTRDSSVSRNGRLVGGRPLVAPRRARRAEFRSRNPSGCGVEP